MWFRLLTDNCPCAMIQKTEYQTVEAEITTVMPLQRARAAESRVRNKLPNGPPRVQSNGGIPQSILQRVGIRQLPGMCRHPARAQGQTCENKVAPRISVFIRP